MKNFGFKLMRILLLPIFKLYYNPKSINKEVIPSEGPLIFCGNHKHVFDQNMVFIATRRVINYMAKKEYFDGHFSWFFKFVGCISVDRSIKDKASVNKAIEILNNNGCIGLFPEGTRNKTDKLLLPFKFGAVSMASKTNATIIPFGIRGEYKFRSKIVIEFGTPFKVEDMSLEEANAKLENEIRNILLKDKNN